MLLRHGKADESIRILEARWKDQLLRMGAESLGVAYARAGRRQDAEQVAAVTPRPASKLLIFAALRDRDRTFEFLNQMLPMGATRVGRELIGPEFAFLRGDPRLKVLRKRLGLPIATLNFGSRERDQPIERGKSGSNHPGDEFPP